MTTGYDPASVPEAPGNGSRFFLASTPKGWGIAPGENVPFVYRALLAEREAEAQAFTPPSAQVALKQVSVIASEYVLEDRHVVTANRSLESRRPGKRWQKLKGGALLDSFFLGGDAFENAPDLEVWEAARTVAETHSLKGKALRDLNDVVAVLVCLRAGVEVKIRALPNVQPLVRAA